MESQLNLRRLSGIQRGVLVNNPKKIPNSHKLLFLTASPFYKLQLNWYLLKDSVQNIPLGSTIIEGGVRAIVAGWGQTSHPGTLLDIL